MVGIRNLSGSIRGKVTAVLMVVCLASLLCAGAMQSILHLSQEREHLAQNLVLTAVGLVAAGAWAAPVLPR